MANKITLIIISTFLILTSYSLCLNFLESIHDVKYYPLILENNNSESYLANIKSNGKGDVTLNTNCLENPSIRNTNVKFTPTHVKPLADVDITVDAEAELDSSIDHVDIEIKLNGKTLTTMTDKHSQEVKKGDALQYSYKNKIPFFLIKGHYQIIARLENAAGSQLSCLSAEFDW